MLELITNKLTKQAEWSLLLQRSILFGLSFNRGGKMGTGRTKFRGYVSSEFLEAAAIRADRTKREISICESVQDKSFYTLFTDLGNNDETLLIISPKI